MGASVAAKSKHQHGRSKQPCCVILVIVSGALTTQTGSGGGALTNLRSRDDAERCSHPSIRFPARSNNAALEAPAQSAGSAAHAGVERRTNEICERSGKIKKTLENKQKILGANEGRGALVAQEPWVPHTSAGAG